MEYQALTQELDVFRQQYPVDESAWSYLIKSGLEVQREVLREFKPKLEGQPDYSALVISFCKRRRQTQQQRELGLVPSASPEVAQERQALEGDVQAFRARYPCDDAAYNYIMGSDPRVIKQVLHSFKPPKEGDQDYSALIISFAKKCRANASSESKLVEDQAEYEAFRLRFPFDEDTHHYLQTSHADVRRYVMRNFKPPREGEADYSALVISFCKRSRNNMNAMSAWGTGPSQAMWPWGKGGWEMASFDPWSAYGYDYGAYGAGGACGACSGCSACGGACGAAACGACGAAACGACGACGGEVAGELSGPIDETGLWSFRLRFPMDDGAFQFLRSAPSAVQQMVLEGFAPPKLEMNYSALIINYTKRCMQSAPLAKRPRMF